MRKKWIELRRHSGHLSGLNEFSKEGECEDRERGDGGHGASIDGTVARGPGKRRYEDAAIIPSCVHMQSRGPWAPSSTSWVALLMFFNRPRPLGMTKSRR